MLKLLQTKLNKRNQDEGFTLIELLVVIAIIGILAAIALPIFLNQQKEAAKASVKSDVHNTAVSVASYLTSNPEATTLPDSVKVITDNNFIAITGTAPTLVICGADPAVAGFTYGYNTTTGLFTEGCDITGATNAQGEVFNDSNVPNPTPNPSTPTVPTTQVNTNVITCGPTTYTFTPGTYSIIGADGTPVNVVIDNFSLINDTGHTCMIQANPSTQIFPTVQYTIDSAVLSLVNIQTYTNASPSMQGRLIDIYADGSFVLDYRPEYWTTNPKSGTMQIGRITTNDSWQTASAYDFGTWITN